MQTQNEYIDLTAPLCQRLQLISRAHLLDLPGMMCLELIDNALNPSLPVCHKVLARSFFYQKTWTLTKEPNAKFYRRPITNGLPTTQNRLHDHQNIFLQKYFLR